MAKLHIYADCTTDEPTKTYECKRVLFEVAQKVVKLTDVMDGKGYAEQIALIGELIQAVFPSITDEEIGGVDVAEMQAFFKDILTMTNGTLSVAQKN